MDAFIQGEILSKINMVIEIIKRIRDALRELILPTQGTEEQKQVE